MKTFWLCFLLTASMGFAQSDKTQLEKSRQNFSDNIPAPAGWVNDYEDLLTDAEEVALNALISKIESETSLEFAVVTIDTSLVAKENFDALVLKIAKTWGVGKKGKDNGIVIGVSAGYRLMRTENGSGMSKVLSDEETSRIMYESLVPDLRHHRYFDGFSAYVKALANELRKKLP